MNIKTFHKNQKNDGNILVVGLGGSAFDLPYTPLDGSSLTLEQVLLTYRIDNDSFPNRQTDYIELKRKNSANITFQDIQSLADLISSNQKYDGFVVLSGTHTLPYITSSLSFLLGPDQKPVVFTGASQSAEDPQSDFQGNFSNSLDVCLSTILGVNVAFGDHLINGTRAVNVGTDIRNPFDSPKTDPIGRFGYGAFTPREDWSPAPIFSGGNSKLKSFFSKNISLDEGIAYYSVKSGIDPRHFASLVDDSTVSGIVLETFGAGNIPAELLPHIYRAVFEFGKPVGVVTSCTYGSADMGLYGIGNDALRAGAISLSDMTKEAAIPKMMFAVGEANQRKYAGLDRIRFIRDVLHTNFFGEISDKFCSEVRDSPNYNALFSDIKPFDQRVSLLKERVYACPLPEIKTYCHNPHQDKILIISTGGTAMEEKDASGEVNPSKKSLSDLLDRVRGLKHIASVDYMTLMNEESSQLRHHEDRIRIAEAIAANKDYYKGIIVIHGTDTMAEAAADLSFMLENIDIPVILTGAQKAGFSPRGPDIKVNLGASIKTILHKDIQPGVKIVFGENIIYGPCAIKIDEYGISAFRTAGHHEVAGKAATNIRLEKDDIIHSVNPFNLFTKYNTNIAYHEMNPLPQNLRQLEKYVDDDKVSAILIGAYDLGEMPEAAIPLIRRAVKEKGKLLLMYLLQNKELLIYQLKELSEMQLEQEHLH